MRPGQCEFPRRRIGTADALARAEMRSRDFPCHYLRLPRRNAEHCKACRSGASSRPVTSSGKTTIPAPSVGASGRRSSEPAVRWLYPVLDGRLTPIPRGSTILGRDEACAIRLEGNQVSRRHAEIVREGAVFLIRDLESRNGIYIDGARVSQAPLRMGALLRVGEWVGLVTMVESQSESPEPFCREILPGYFVGPVLAPCLAPLQRAAAADLPIIVQGETGTGKEGVAQAAHLWSGRRRDGDRECPSVRARAAHT